MSSLSTHVLDTMRGGPAAGVALRLYRGGEMLHAGVTNTDGRCADLPAVAAGSYRLEFEIGAYFLGRGAALPRPPFLGVVPIAFGVAEPDGHYHIPLLVSPYGYSTYRGG